MDNKRNTKMLATAYPGHELVEQLEIRDKEIDMLIDAIRALVGNDAGDHNFLGPTVEVPR